MENDRGSMGVGEIPPEGAHGRDNPPKEGKPNPPVDRPVYSIPEKDSTNSSPPSEDNNLNFTPLLVAGMIVLAIIGTYLYSSNVATPLLVNVPIVAVEPKIEVEEVVEAKAVISANKGDILKVETLRTIGILEQMEATYSDNPSKLAKVKSLKADAQKILESVENEIRVE